MNKNKVVIVTEANEKVATGHLMECVICAETLLDNGYYISFWINNDADVRLKTRIPCEYKEYKRNIEVDYDELVAEINRINPCAVILNLREVSGEFVAKLKALTKFKILCIDEYGHRYLPADIIINPMIDPYYWQYEGEKIDLYCGAQYLVLSEKLERLHSMEKPINSNIDNILISMGGVDPRDYTTILVNEIPQIFPNASIDIILGGGYINRQNIYNMAAGYNQVKIYENVTTMPEMIFGTDLIICAGGNTLHEAACIGTPAIIMPSMPHEIRTAKYFEKSGFGYVVNTSSMLCENLAECCDRINNSMIRKEMSHKGKQISDGLGRKRIIEILEKV